LIASDLAAGDGVDPHGDLARKVLALVPSEFALLGNVGTLIALRVGVPDAEVPRQRVLAEFGVENLGACGRTCRLMIDGVVSRPFSAGALGAGTTGYSNAS
jgi:hypothetical protein